MSRSSRVLRKGTGLLCTVLVLNLHVMTGGCGVGGVASPDGTLVIQLTPSMALTHALKGSLFDGATAIEVSPMEGTFSLVFPGGERQLSGSYGADTGRQAITSLHLSRAGVSADVSLDFQKRITAIQTSAGQRWERPADWTGLPNNGAAMGVDAYIGANIELVEIARSLGGGNAVRTETTSSGGSDDGSGTVSLGVGVAKGGAASQGGDIGSILGTLGLILGIQAVAAFWPSIYFVLQVVLGVQVLMAFGGITPEVDAAPNTGGSAILAGDAVLRVINNLSDDTPVWFVTLLEDSTTSAPAGNVLGDESIPAGTSRDFQVPSGTRDINVILPSGVDCYWIQEHKGVVLGSGAVTELTVADTDTGILYPDECDNSQ